MPGIGPLDESVDVEAQRRRINEDEANNPMRNTNSSAYYRSMEKKGGVRYTPLTADDLADDADQEGNNEYRGDDFEKDDELVNSKDDVEISLDKRHVDVSLNNPLQVDSKVEIENKLEMSAIKKRHW